MGSLATIFEGKSLDSWGEVNMVEQIVFVCGSEVVLTQYGGEKKSMRESPLETRCRI